jgi:hypothetical protein
MTRLPAHPRPGANCAPDAGVKTTPPAGVAPGQS